MQVTRPDAGRREPFPPRRIVLIDQLNQAMDRIEVEAGFPGRRLTSRALGLEPCVRLPGAEP
jgi:hypothetical protein